MDKNLISYSMSGADIIKELNGKCNLVKYSDIRHFKTLEELLGKYKKCIILYETKQNYGHWTCIYEHNGTVYFFDSYGVIPNGQLKFIPTELNKALEQDHKHLIKLLLDSNKPVEYNEYRLQELKENVNTCGKWVTFRLKYPFVSVEDFGNLFKNKGGDFLINQLVKIN